MNDAPLPTFAFAIRAMHDASARHIATERVCETFRGETVWEGDVLVFELSGHPAASRCYAWEVDGEVTAVLAVPPVKTARDAVRASIAADEGEAPEAG